MKSDTQKVPKQAEAKRNDVITPQNHYFSKCCFFFSNLTTDRVRVRQTDLDEQDKKQYGPVSRSGVFELILMRVSRAIDRCSATELHVLQCN